MMFLWGHMKQLVYIVPINYFFEWLGDRIIMAAEKMQENPVIISRAPIST